VKDQREAIFVFIDALLGKERLCRSALWIYARARARHALDNASGLE